MKSRINSLWPDCRELRLALAAAESYTMTPPRENRQATRSEQRVMQRRHVHAARSGVRQTTSWPKYQRVLTMYEAEN